MALIIQKFGGTSVATIERINKIVQIIKTELENSNQVIVIVSAMAGVTNSLITLCNEVATINDQSRLAEYDAALASGEQVSAALLSLALLEHHISARSIQGWEIIQTNDVHGKALALSVNTKLLEENLKSNCISVICGFQGLGLNGRITTLGRGGSDTSAAIIAAAMKAVRCDIYTDVEGVFTADPRIVHNAKKLEALSYLQMLELASSGAKVLHPRCIEIAMRYNLPLRVLSSFAGDNNSAGTVIIHEENIMEQKLVIGISDNRNILLLNLESQNYGINFITNLLLKQKISIELSFTNSPGLFSYILPLAEKSKLEKFLHNLKQSEIINDFSINSQIAQITLVGYGIKNDLEFASKILSEVEANDIYLMHLQLSDIKMSFIAPETNVENIIRILHQYIS